MGTNAFDQLKEKITSKSCKVGVVGLGYVGLPLAVSYAHAGFDVLGIDVQSDKVADVNRGHSYLSDVSDQQLTQVLETGRLRATTDMKQLAKANAIIACIPTPISKTKEPDLSFVVSAVTAVAGHLRAGQLVVLESTTYPGTTREVVMPLLQHNGLQVGRDVFLAYSPERIDPGNKKFGIQQTPKLVGGIDDPSTQLAALLYRNVVDNVFVVSSPEIAEMTKLYENIFRQVNIALVNELASLCEKMQISIWEVIEAASTKPFGYLPFFPGPGIGGHCIPLDPYYLAYKAREYDFHVEFIELAARTNERMPYHVVSRIIELLSVNGKAIRNADILVLGTAYKKDIEDMRESPSYLLISLFKQKGANVTYNDPYVAEVRIDDVPMHSVELTAERLAAADITVIATDHSSYDYQFIADNAQLVFDTRGATKKIPNGNIYRLGE